MKSISSLQVLVLHATMLPIGDRTLMVTVGLHLRQVEVDKIRAKLVSMEIASPIVNFPACAYASLWSSLC